MTATALHDPACRRCPRLADFLDGVRTERADYFAAPVPGFGPPGGRLLIVGLAPGMHGANRTGRPFTGDYAGLLLYRGLHALGFLYPFVPAGLGALILLAVALLVNNLSSNRKYPEYWF